uniref:Uncharacterized protein n=1 Tax=Schistocephalus solidus TaxID=70667 RepID=A0A0X3NUL4_SCHSO
MGTWRLVTRSRPARQHFLFLHFAFHDHGCGGFGFEPGTSNGQGSCLAYRFYYFCIYVSVIIFPCVSSILLPVTPGFSHNSLSSVSFSCSKHRVSCKSNCY